jgi:hypothetical protein
LADAFTYQEYLDVASNDDVRVEQCSTGGYTIQEFKQQNDNNTEFIYVSWNGQSGRATTSSTVYLQVYNQVSPGWETLDSDNATAANTDFDMSGSVTTNVANYYAAGNWV